MPRPKQYPDRRTYARLHARKKREAKLAELQRTSTTCPRQQGSGRCGGLLETVVLEGGRTRIVCPLCERRKRGICRDCPRPVEGQIGKAIRCARCKQRARNEQIRMSELRNHERRRRMNKARRDELKQTRDPRYLARLEYKRAYRKAHPEKIRAQKQRSWARRRASLLGEGGYFPEYRRKHAAHLRDLQRQKTRARQALWTPPVCTVEGCGAVIQYDWQPRGRMFGTSPARCDAHCWPFELRERNAKRSALVERARAEMLAGVSSRTRVARRPPGYYATRAAGGLRKCLTPGCETVLTGRRKKCRRCKEREAQLAAVVIAEHRGRGRRLDLERSA